jgi:hypothetical protein
MINLEAYSLCHYLHENGVKERDQLGSFLGGDHLAFILHLYLYYLMKVFTIYIQEKDVNDAIAK